VPATWELPRRGHDPAAAFAEPDRHCAGTPATGTEDHFVAVFEIAPGFAVAQRNCVAAAEGHFQQAADARRVGSGNRAAAKQITGPQVAAVRRVVRDHLRRGPVKIARIGSAQAKWLGTGGAHCRRNQEHLAVDVECAVRLISHVEKMRQRRRIALGSGGLRHAERLQCLRRDDPR
jgi:hypothetical protein